MSSWSSSSSSSVLLGVLCSVVNGTWIYTWPYDPSGSCKCVESDVGSYLSFDTSTECLESFANEEGEYCTSESLTLSLSKCASAVSKRTGALNTDCQAMCTEMVADVISSGEFFETCQFELFEKLTENITITATENSCFSNYVYGSGTGDDALTVYRQVDTPAECQELCQFTVQCALFTWNASSRDCALYSNDYISALLNTNQYCQEDQFKAQNCPDVFNEDDKTWNPFSQGTCLSCGCQYKCAWKSESHISGPRFCGDSAANVCNYPLSDFTTTTTPVVCPTQTCKEVVLEEKDSRTTTELVLLDRTTTDVALDDPTTTTTSGSPSSTTTGLVLDTVTRKDDCSTCHEDICMGGEDC